MVIQFSLDNSVPKSFSKAELAVYGYSGPGSAVCELHKINESIQIDTVTWYHQFTMKKIGFVEKIKPREWIVFNITKELKKIRKRNKKYLAVVIQIPDSAHGAMRCYSSDNTENPSQRPLLRFYPNSSIQKKISQVNPSMVSFTNGFLQINTTSKGSSLSEFFTIFNTQGKIVKRGSIEQGYKKIPLHFSQGVYYVQIGRYELTGVVVGK